MLILQELFQQKMARFLKASSFRCVLFIKTNQRIALLAYGRLQEIGDRASGVGFFSYGRGVVRQHHDLKRLFSLESV